MATLAQSLRGMVDKIRELPGILGVHTHVVTRVTRTYAAVIGRGTYTDVSAVLRNGTHNVHCRLADDDVASQVFGDGCQWHDGDYIVGPITPSVKYAASSFDVADGTASRIFYTIAGTGIGTENGYFMAVTRNFSRPFSWHLLLRRTEFGT